MNVSATDTATSTGSTHPERLTDEHRALPFKWWIPLVGIVILALLYFVLRPERPVEVIVVTAEQGTVEETVVNTRAGTVKSRQRARLSPELGGRVARLPFREGDRVEEGDLLLELDATLEQRRLTLSLNEESAALAQVKQACLAAEQAAREEQRLERLAAENIVAEEVWERSVNTAQRAEASCEAARATAEEANSAVALARANLEKTALFAPFSGVIAEQSIEVGEWTTPSPPALPVPPVIDLLNLEGLYITAPIDEVDAGRIHTGQHTRVVVDSHRNLTFLGTVTRIAPYVLDKEAQNRTIEVEVELEPFDSSITLFPGTSADVEILVQQKEAIRIPASALYDQNKVLVLEQDRLVERTIEAGLRNWRFVEVKSGLGAGERVVTSLDDSTVESGTRATERSP